MSILSNSFVNIINALLHDDRNELAVLISTITQQEINLVTMRSIMLTDKTELLEILLQADADINFRDKEGRTPLFLAVKYNRLSMIRLLINRGSDVNLGKFNQSTALHLAAKKGTVEVIQLLVQASHVLDALNWGGNTALLIGCRFSHTGAVTKLISLGANVNICNKLGHYPLHYAAFAGNANLVKILMTKGANPDVRTHLGINPIMLACERKHCSVVTTLAPKCDLHYREQLYGGTVLHWAIASGCCHCVDILLKHGASLKLADSTGRTPILEAVQSRRPEILKYLLDKHRAQDFAIESPNASILHLASFLGHKECISMICTHDHTKHLLDVKDYFGEPPIDLALKVGNKEAINLLLTHGVDITHIVSLHLEIDTVPTEADSDIHSEGRDNDSICSSSSTEQRNSKQLSGMADNPDSSGGPSTLSLRTDSSEIIAESLDAKDKLSDLCMESTRTLRTQCHHKIFKTYSAIKMGMIDMLRSASTQQMVAPVRFDFNTWLDNGPEAFVLKVTSLDLTNWIHQRMHTPWSLRELCRGCIRKVLGYRASDKVEKLPVPKTLQEFLNLKELEEIETSDIQIRSTGAFDDIDIE